MKKLVIPIAIRSILLAATLLGASASSHAAVLTYYRFETSPGFLNDSSGNGFNLTNVGTATNSTVLGNIPTTIPQTGASNARLAQTLVDQSLRTPDQTSFNTSTFTIEAYGRTFDGNFHVMASQANTVGNQLAWRFGLNVGADTIILSLSSTGSTFVDFTTPFTINSNEDFYMAATVNITGSGTTVKFYYDNLTNATPLANATVTNASFTSIFNTNSDLVLGGMLGAGGALVNDWNGRIDEFRFSDTVLAESQLLAVPEPSTFVMLALTGLALVIARNRRKQQGA